MFNRVLVIGDVHGNYDKLMNLWEQIHYTDDDFLIFLGDYIDRGDKPLECLDFVMNLVKNHKNVHALMGNHEWFMQNYFKKYTLDESDAFMDDWMMERNGGSVTLHALKDVYVKNPEKAMKYIEFVNNLDVYNEDIDGIFFVHAGVNPDRDLHSQTIEDMVWIREDCYNYYDNEEVSLVVGHTPVQYFGWDKPTFLENNILLMDTGSFIPNGKISCVDLKSGKLYQSKG